MLRRSWLLVGLIAIAGADCRQEKSLVGTWSTVTSDSLIQESTETWTFRADGTFSSSIEALGKSGTNFLSRTSGAWSLDGDTLVLDVVASEFTSTTSDGEQKKDEFGKSKEQHELTWSGSNAFSYTAQGMTSNLKRVEQS